IYSVGAGSGYFSEILLKDLQVHEALRNPQWQPSNVIVLLGSGSTKWNEEHYSTQTYGYSRLNEAARLYFNCKKSGQNCKILMSGGDPAGIGKSEAEIMHDELVGNNISKEDLIVENLSLNTFENAKFSSAIIKEHHFENIILVTSGTHMKRSLMFFKIFNINATPAVSDKLLAKMQWESATKNVMILDTCLHEHAGLVKYYAFEMLGKN
ncbi:MAG: YdcF family protein, partial [Pseudobdellovibrio sp.]